MVSTPVMENNKSECNSLYFSPISTKPDSDVGILWLAIGNTST